jgi:hypothetical protein
MCFATTKTWASDAISAIDIAVSRAGSRVTVSVLEGLGTSAPKSRRVLHNPAGA